MPVRIRAARPDGRRVARGAARGIAAAGAALALAAGLGACGDGDGSGSAATTGEEIYQASCAGCHGTDGEGDLGPGLVGVADRYPVVDDEIAVVKNGRGDMPAFGSRLSDRQIRKVVDYERTELGG